MTSLLPIVFLTCCPAFAALISSILLARRADRSSSDMAGKYFSGLESKSPKAGRHTFFGTQMVNVKNTLEMIKEMLCNTASTVPHPIPV